jgi:hypothetical protein
VFRAHVFKWAAASNGHFESVFSRSCVCAADAVSRNETHLIKWAATKRWHRSVEKVSRSYNNKPWLLVDVVRQSVIYDSILDIVKCLQVISDDPNVQIVRIKNRLSRDYDDTLTAGYRDVVININLVSEETVTLTPKPIPYTPTPVCVCVCVFVCACACTPTNYCNMWCTLATLVWQDTCMQICM